MNPKRKYMSGSLKFDLDHFQDMCIKLTGSSKRFLKRFVCIEDSASYYWGALCHVQSESTDAEPRVHAFVSKDRESRFKERKLKPTMFNICIPGLMNLCITESIRSHIHFDLLSRKKGVGGLGCEWKKRIQSLQTDNRLEEKNHRDTRDQDRLQERITRSESSRLWR